MKKTTITAATILAWSVPAFSAITVKAYFEMGDNGQGADNRPADSSANARDFTGIEGGAATINPSEGGFNNGAYYSFDGSRGYFDIGYVAPNDHIGLEVWVRTSNLTQSNKTLFSTGSALNGISVGYSGGWFGAVAGVAGVGFFPPEGYTPGEWVHLAVVRDSGTTTFYFNGAPSGTSGATPNAIGANNVHTGWTPEPSTGGFEGDIAQARIFTFEPGEFAISDLLFPGFSPPSTAFVRVGANANFLTTELSTDVFSVFRLGGTASDFANVTEPDGLSVVLDNQPAHEIDIEVEGPLEPGNYPLIGYSGTIGGLGFGGLELFQITSFGRPYTGSLANTGSTIDLVITGGGPANLMWTGSESPVWDDQTTNWKFTVGETATTFFEGDVVRFDDSVPGASPLTVTLSGLIEPNSVAVDNETKNYTFTGSGIGGTASLVKSGAATLILANPNDHSGTTVIEGGRVVVAPGGSPGSGTLTNDAVLEFTNIDPLTVATVINGEGLIEKTGSGSLLLSGNNSGLTGDISHQAGFLRSGNPNSLGAGPGIASVTAGASLDINGIGFGAKPVHVSGVGVGGLGAIVNNAGLLLGGINDLTLVGNATIGGTGRWDVRGSTTTVQGDHTLTKVGANEIGFVLGLYTVRDIVVTQGRLSVEHGAVLDNSSPGIITVTGGSLGVGDYGLPASITKPIILNGGALGTTSGSNLGNSTIAAPVTLAAAANPFVILPGATVRLEGPVSGSGALLMPMSGGGTLVLASAPTYTGNTSVDLGTLVLEQPGLDDNSTVSIGSGGTLRLDFPGSDTVGALMIDGVSQPDGAYNAGHSSGRFAGGGILWVGDGASTPAGYANWAASFPGLTDTDPALDFDGDGLPTGIEYVVGGDPTVSDAAEIAPTFDHTTDPDNFLFIYRLSDLAAADPSLTVAVEYSSTLADWIVAGHDPAETGVTISVSDVPGEDHDLVTVAIPRSLAVEGRLFARLSITLTTGPTDADGRPLINKLGTIDVDLVETTPIVFNERLYRFEWVRESYHDNQHGVGYFRLIDHATGEVATPPFAHNFLFGSAFVADGTIHVTGTSNEAGWTGHRVRIFSSSDLENWEDRDALDLEGFGIANTSICKTSDDYVMMFEIHEPFEQAGQYFTARFARSKDLLEWELTPENHVYSKDRYTAPHAIRYLDGWYYNFYLEAHEGYEMRVVRSRDLIEWIPSPLNPVLRASDDDRKIANPSLTAGQREAIALATNINNSDIDFCEFEGRLIINYSWGDQNGTEFLAEAVYEGSERQFLTGWFPRSTNEQK